MDFLLLPDVRCGMNRYIYFNHSIAYSSALCKYINTKYPQGIIQRLTLFLCTHTTIYSKFLLSPQATNCCYYRKPSNMRNQLIRCYKNVDCFKCLWPGRVYGELSLGSTVPPGEIHTPSPTYPLQCSSSPDL